MKNTAKTWWIGVMAFLFLGFSGLQAAPIAIPNAGFEEPPQNAGGWTNTLTDWSERDGIDDGDSFIENISGFFAEGINHIGMNTGYYIWIDTGVAWEPNTVYTLQVAAGNRGGQTGGVNSSVYALMNSTAGLGAQNAANTAAVLNDSAVLASRSWDAAANVGAGQFGEAPPLEFVVTDAVPTGTIVILLGDNSPSGRSHFDNIRLETGTNEDADQDGLPQDWEEENGLSDSDDGSTNPNNGPNGDPDSDGLTNLQEFNDRTDPQDGDSDDDGLSDGDEVTAGTNPLNNDTDSDGLLDGVETNTGVFVDADDTGTSPLSVDTDSDGLFDSYEVTNGSNPTDVDDPVTPAVGFAVNFTSAAGDGAPLEANEIAGFPEVAMRNWNNGLPGVSVGDLATISGAALVDSAGDDITDAFGTSISWNSNTVWQIGNQYPGAGATIGGDSKMFTGYIDNTADAGDTTIDLTNIPYPSYDVYVYFGSDGNDRTGAVALYDESDTELGRFDFTTDASRSPFRPEDYIITESTDSSFPSSHVAIFRGITETNLEIRHLYLGANCGIAGFQIVSAAPLDTVPRITNLTLDQANGFLDFDAINLTAGRTYHVEAGVGLDDFAAVAGSDFTAGTPVEEVSLLVDFGVFTKYFVRVKEGPIPGP
ncbi:MAG: hypothetical protein ACON4R_03570 [Akkermansiaceae bacterium]